ncbi:odorant receptor Or1-like [Culex pipiens pallens]|uniref:odorant receptor Or1-like n=1 Tax=Culex pipiens pallens TaxID=42434 RepID=UPI0019532EF4|nr:odorant receptor Or1-like [Culex pipiens pallens]
MTIGSFLLHRVFYWYPWNPTKRLQSFERQVALLRFVGLWPPLEGSPRVRTAYRIYGWCFRILFMYIYTLTQVLYFVDVRDLKGVANALFLLMTQISLLIKLEIFNRKIVRIQKCVQDVECPLYSPGCKQEDKEVIKAMNNTWLIGTIFMTTCYGTVTFWTISTLYEWKRQLMLPAWFPFDYSESLLVFIPVWLYQAFGIYMSATYNVATDTLATGLISHVSGQTARFGILISKLGHKPSGFIPYNDLRKHCSNCIMCTVISSLTKDINYYNDSHGPSYGYLVELTYFHKGLLCYAREIIDIFNVSIFTQIIASVIIICMTGLRLLAGHLDPWATTGDVFYLLAMICQIWQFCYVGNEVSHSVDKINEMAMMCNYPKFNKPTARAFLILLTRAMQKTEIKVGVVFKFTLSLSTFLWILKTSYSYFAVLNSAQS